MRSHLPTIAAASILLTFGMLAFMNAEATSPTSDELTHLAAGISYISAGNFRLNREHPPLLKAIAALPWLERSFSPTRPPRRMRRREREMRGSARGPTTDRSGGSRSSTEAARSSAGRSVVYTSSSAALAALELLVRIKI